MFSKLTDVNDLVESAIIYNSDSIFEVTGILDSDYSHNGEYFYCFTSEMNENLKEAETQFLKTKEKVFRIISLIDDPSSELTDIVMKERANFI